MESSEQNSHVITLDQSWLKSLKKRVTETEWRRWRSEQATIFRVPKNIRDAEPKAYEPKLISLGPYHHGKPALKAMDDLKWLYLKNFLSRTSHDHERELEFYLKKIKALESRARSSYSDQPVMASNEFVQMLLLDGSFLVELFVMRTEPRKGGVQAEEDPIISTTWTLPLLVLDMLMIENQLPFFLLQDLFDSINSREEPWNFSLIDLVFDFFDYQDLLPMSMDAVYKVPRCHHILHLFHSSILPVPPDQQNDRSKKNASWMNSFRRTLSSSVNKLLPRKNKLWRRREKRTDPTPESIPCATELKEAGVGLKRKKKAKSFLEVAFRGWKVEIPQIHVYDQTLHLLRNLIAFEQCYPHAGSDVTTYAVAMDCIIDTPADVALLQRRRIIMNGLGNDEELAELFNKLCKEVAIDYDECYLSDLFKNVNKHCRYRVNRWRAKLNHNYLSSPWVIISVFGAFILLVLTILQTVYTILGIPVNQSTLSVSARRSTFLPPSSSLLMGVT